MLSMPLSFPSNHCCNPSFEGTVSPTGYCPNKVSSSATSSCALPDVARPGLEGCAVAIPNWLFNTPSRGIGHCLAAQPSNALAWRPEIAVFGPPRLRLRSSLSSFRQDCPTCRGFTLDHWNAVCSSSQLVTYALLASVLHDT